jgi:hypothetical protein
MSILVATSSCTSTSTVKQELEKSPSIEIDNQPDIVIKLPVIQKQKIQSIFFNTQKLYTDTKKGINYTFFYGNGGRVIVKIVSESSQIDFTKANAELIFMDEKNPETLSLATAGDGVFTGFGNERTGAQKMKFKFEVPETKNNSFINEEFDLTVNIQNLN